MYQTLHIETVVVEAVLYALDLGFELFAGTVDWLHFLLRFGFVAKLKIADFLR